MPGINQVSNSKNKLLKIGFDFDGVILFNPARTLRPFISLLKAKQVGVKRKHLEFYHPHNTLTKTMWWLAHQTSLLPAQGLDELRKLIGQQKIEAHLITGRNSYLANDLLWKLRLFGLNDLFKTVQITKDTLQQPHLFKAELIKKLGLDIFVEDNWDIVSYLAKQFDQKDPKQPRIYWITNRFDKRFAYPYRFNNLTEVIKAIKG